MDFKRIIINQYLFFDVAKDCIYCLNWWLTGIMQFCFFVILAVLNVSHLVLWRCSANKVLTHVFVVFLYAYSCQIQQRRASQMWKYCAFRMRCIKIVMSHTLPWRQGSPTGCDAMSLQVCFFHLSTFIKKRGWLTQKSLKPTHYFDPIKFLLPYQASKKKKNYSRISLPCLF